MKKSEKSEVAVVAETERVSDTTDAKDKAPTTFYEFVWKFVTESGEGVSWWAKFVVALILGLTPETRELAMAMADRGWTEFRRNLNWFINTINAAVQALLVGGILLAAVGTLSLVAAAQIPIWTDRWRVMGLCLLSVTPILLWMFSQTMDIFMRLGALAGAVTTLDSDEFKAAKGLNPLTLIGRGSQRIVSGGLGAMWALARKLAWIGMWIYIGIAYPMIFPVHNVPELLWVSPALIFIQIVLHAFREQFERGKEWGVIQRITLTIFAFIGILSMLPEGVQVLTMERGSMASFISRVVAVLIGIWIVSWAIRSSDKDLEKQRAQASVSKDAVAEVVAPSGTYQAVRTPEPPKPNYLLRAIPIVGLMVIVFGGLFILTQLFNITDRFTTIRGFNIDGSMRGVNAAGIASAATLSEPVPTTAPSVEVTQFTVEFKAGPGDLMDREHPISVEPGDSLEIKVVQGSYAALGALATVDGTWNGKAIRPIENTRVFTTNGYTPDFVNNDDLFGVMYVRTGPKTPLTIVGTNRTVIVQKKGDLSFMLNIPQRTDLATEFSGQIVVNVKRTRKTKE